VKGNLPRRESALHVELRKPREGSGLTERETILLEQRHGNF
jgi:hypothetical protein